jgi:hypothetical protein
VEPVPVNPISTVARIFAGAMSFYALVIAVAWVAITQIMFISDYHAVTGQALPDALASGSKPAQLWVQTKRLVGVQLLAGSILMLFVIYRGFNAGERWAWFALLAWGLITWGSMLAYKAIIGYFRLAPSSLTFIIGAVLWLVAVISSARSFLGPGT